MKVVKFLIWFISILVAVFITLIIVHLDKIKIVIGKDMLEMTISIFTDIVGIFLAAILAYFTAYIQLNNEKSRLEKEKNIEFLNKLTVLLDEVENNKKYIETAKNKDVINIALIISNFSAKEWEKLKLEINFNEDEFKKINSLYRFYYLLDKQNDPGLERLSNLQSKIENTVIMLNTKMNALKEELKK